MSNFYEQQMDILWRIAQWRTPLGEWLMGLITHLGEETLFIVIALTAFWCWDKRKGYYLLFTGFSGILSNQFLKMLFRVPRPWRLDGDFCIVESARAEATGYSFPSGHTQSAATLYGSIARTAKRAWVRIALILLCLVIGFSRLYLGVHTLHDVGVALLLGAALVLLLYPIFCIAYRSTLGMMTLIGVMVLLCFGNLVFLYLSHDGTNLVEFRHAMESAWKLLGMILGMAVMYPIEKHGIRFETRAPWWGQLLKLVLGFAAVMAVRLLLKQPLNALLGEFVGGGLRYFLVVLTAGIVVPLFFPKKKKQK